MDLAEFLYTALLYQAMTNRNINAATLLEQYSVLDLVEKKNNGASNGVYGTPPVCKKK